MAVTGKMLGAQKRLVSTAPVNVLAGFKITKGSEVGGGYQHVLLPKFIVLQDYICVISSAQAQYQGYLYIVVYKMVNGTPTYIGNKSVRHNFANIITNYYIPFTCIRGGLNSLLFIGTLISAPASISAIPITITDSGITQGSEYVLCTDAYNVTYAWDCCYLSGNTAFLTYVKRRIINSSTGQTEDVLTAMSVVTSNGSVSIGLPISLGLSSTSTVTPRNVVTAYPIYCCAISSTRVMVIQPTTAHTNSAAFMPVAVNGSSLSAQSPNYSVNMGTSIFAGGVTTTRGNSIATSGCMYIYSISTNNTNSISGAHCIDVFSYDYLGSTKDVGIINTMWVENDVAYFYDRDQQILYKASSTDKQNRISIYQNLLPLNSKDFILGFSKGMAVIVHQENPSYAYLTAVKANFNGSSLTRIADNTALVSGENGKTKQISSLYFDTPNTNDYFSNKVQLLLNGTPFYTQTVTQSEKMLLPNCPIVLNPSDVLKVQTTTGVSDMYVTAFGLEETV